MVLNSFDTVSASMTVICIDGLLFGYDDGEWGLALAFCCEDWLSKLLPSACHHQAVPHINA